MPWKAIMKHPAINISLTVAWLAFVAFFALIVLSGCTETTAPTASASASTTTVTVTVDGSGSAAAITVDIYGGTTQTLSNVSLPWSETLTTDAGDTVQVTAQNGTGVGEISAQIDDGTSTAAGIASGKFSVATTKLEVQ